MRRMAKTILAVTVMMSGGQAAATAHGLDPLTGGVIRHVTEVGSIDIFPGKTRDCQNHAVGVRCAVDNGSVVIDGKTFRLHSYVSIDDQHVFVGDWRQNINGITIASDLAVVLNPAGDGSGRLQGYVQLDKYHSETGVREIIEVAPKEP